MKLTEKDLEKKTLAEIGALARGYEEKSRELAAKVGDGRAKPADLISHNAALALLKKVLAKKTAEQDKHVQRGQTKSAGPLKSYEDYVKNKSEK
jgi:hypothetical protein